MAAFLLTLASYNGADGEKKERRKEEEEENKRQRRRGEENKEDKKLGFVLRSFWFRFGFELNMCFPHLPLKFALLLTSMLSETIPETFQNFTRKRSEIDSRRIPGRSQGPSEG